MGDRRSWVGGFVVHERGVRERGGGVIVRKRAVVAVRGRSSQSVGGRRSPWAVVAVRGRSSFVGGRGSRVGVVHMVSLVRVVVVWDRRSWVVAVRPWGGIVVHPWRGSSSSVSGGRGRRCPCVLVLRGRLSFLGGGHRRTWAVNVCGWGGGRQRPWSFPLVEGGVVVVPRRWALE
jgi:hypothetical protein